MVVSRRDVPALTLVEHQPNAADLAQFALEASGVGTWHFDLTTGLLVWSEICKAMFGGVEPPTGIEGFLSLIHPADRPGVYTHFTGVVDGATQEFDTEFRVVWPDGTAHWLRSKGRSTHPVLQGIVIDIAQRKDNEESLLRAKHRAERQDAAKSKFLAAASHDLRQPLQTMVFLADSLSRHIAPEGRDAYEKLRNAIQTQGQLLDNLLDVTRLDSALVRPHIEEFPIYDVLRPVAEAFEHKAAVKGVSIHAVQSNVVVRSDRHLLFRMISHLIENAVRFTDRGRILIDCLTRGDTVTVEVRDSGVGISPRDIDHIWDEFYQIGNARRERQQGQGLGLAIVRRLSELLSHPVQATSEVGVGSIFAIDIPRSESDIRSAAEAAQAAEAHRVPRTIITAEETRRPLVMIVDDDAMLREAYETIFEDFGEWDTVLAESADAAMQAIPAGRVPDILIMDYRLGSETGDEATKRLRSHFGTVIPAVMLTGDVGDEVQDRARENDMPIMYKPVDTKALHMLVREKIGSP